MQHEHLHGLLIYYLNYYCIYSWSWLVSTTWFMKRYVLSPDLQIDITMGLTKRNLETSAIKTPWPNVEATKEKLPICASKLYNCMRHMTKSLYPPQQNNNSNCKHVYQHVKFFAIAISEATSDESWDLKIKIDSTRFFCKWSGISSGEKVVPRDAIL